MPSLGSGDRSSVFTSESVPDEYERHLVPAVFAPWAEVLLDAVGVGVDQALRVLDIASGTGVLARAAARRVGTAGSVVASDVSEPMLARGAAVGPVNGGASIEYRRASADSLPFEDGSFDAVLCQQGLQFFPARSAAVDEMRRVLRPGGVAGVAVWAQGHPLEPFGVYGDALVAIGAAPPFPGAFESDSYTLGLDTVRALFTAAGYGAVDARVLELEVSWPDPASAAAGVLGTPFGPLVRGLSLDQQAQLQAEMEKRFAPSEPGTPVRRRTAAVIVTAAA